MISERFARQETTSTGVAPTALASRMPSLKVFAGISGDLRHLRHLRYLKVGLAIQLAGGGPSLKTCTEAHAVPPEVATQVTQLQVVDWTGSSGWVCWATMTMGARQLWIRDVREVCLAQASYSPPAGTRPSSTPGQLAVRAGGSRQRSTGRLTGKGDRAHRASIAKLWLWQPFCLVWVACLLPFVLAFCRFLLLGPFVSFPRYARASDTADAFGKRAPQAVCLHQNNKRGTAPTHLHAHAGYRFSGFF